MPKITEDELKKQIKNRQFSPVYILYGTEQMYVKSYTQKLVTAVAGKNPSDFNFYRFSGEVNPEELDNAAQAVPFMSEYNCVLMEDIFFDMMSESDLNYLKDILARTVDTTVMILSMPSNVPKSKKAAFSAIVKKAEENGSVCEFNQVSQSTLERFIAKWANESGKMISRVNAAKLIASCGDDLTRLKNEVAKICAYAKGEEVTAEDIGKLATVNLESKIYDLSDAVINNNPNRAFEVLDLLFYQKEEPISMLYTLSNTYIDAYRIRVAGECGVYRDAVVQDFGYAKNRAFTLDKAKRSTAYVSTEALRKSLDALIEADLKFKSVKINPRLYMEQLIAQLLLIAREGKA